MQLNLSDKESSTGSSGHNNSKESWVRYRCPGCSQMLIREKDPSEHEVQSGEPITRRACRTVLELMPPPPTLQLQSPNQTISRRDLSSSAHRSQPQCNCHLSHPNYRGQKIPVVAEQDVDDGAGRFGTTTKRTRDFLSLFNDPTNPTDDPVSKRTRDFLSLFNGTSTNSTERGRDGLTLSDHAFTKLTLRDPFEFWGTQEPETDLKLKPWV